MPSTGKGVTVSNNDEDFIDDSEPPLVYKHVDQRQL
jgi:hypothetical protein